MDMVASSPWVLRTHFSGNGRVSGERDVIGEEVVANQSNNDDDVWFWDRPMPQDVERLQAELTKSAPAILAAIRGL